MASPGFSRIRFTVTLVLCTIVVLGTITTWWVERQLSGPLVEWARLRATNIASAAINGAVQKIQTAHLQGAGVVRYVNGDGTARPFIRYDMSAVNQVMATAAQTIIEALQARAPEDFNVPLGELSGMRIFAGWGPPIPVRILTVGSAVAEPKVDFKAAGINQVVHRVYLDVTVRMVVLAPLIQEEIVVAQPVILAEEVFPGEVPATYVNLVGFSGGLAEWAAVLEAARQGGSVDPAKSADATGQKAGNGSVTPASSRGPSE